MDFQSPTPTLALVSMLLFGCGGTEPAMDDGSNSAFPMPPLGATAAAERMTLLDSPASSPGTHPVLNRGRDGVTRLLWSEPWKESGARIFVSRFDGGGFGPARRVVQLGDAFVNWADVPTLAAMADGTLCVTWLAKTAGDTYAYGVRYALSRDDGVSWSIGETSDGDGFEQASSPWLHSDSSHTEHGFVSTVALEDRFVAIWLDGRAVDAGGPQQLWSRSIRPDGTLGTETLVDESVCDCCSTALMVEAGSDSTLIAAWRDRSSEEVRDIHWARLVNGSWRPLGPVHVDDWVIPGCPVNGPRLGSVNEANLCVWTSGESRDGAWVAPLVLPFAVPKGAGTRQEAIALNENSTLGRLGLAPMSNGKALASWLELESVDSAAWRLRTVEEDGSGSMSVGEPWTLATTSASRSSGILRLVSLGHQPGDGVLAAWNDEVDGGILVALIHPQ